VGCFRSFEEIFLSSIRRKLLNRQLNILFLETRILIIYNVVNISNLIKVWSLGYSIVHF
jgi:hypothetical protein